MFSVEKIAANILTHYLGTYVEGLKEKNLQISLMKGSVNLSNLQLKKEALDGLELPITVKSGMKNIYTQSRIQYLLLSMKGIWEN